MSFLLSISMTSNFSGSILYLASTCYFALQIIVIFVVHICIHSKNSMYFVGRFLHLNDVDHESFPPKAVKKGPQIKENRQKTWHVPRWLGAFLAIPLTQIWFFFCSWYGEPVLLSCRMGSSSLRWPARALTWSARPSRLSLWRQTSFCLDTFSKRNLKRG